MRLFEMETSLAEVAELIKRDCQPYLNQIAKYGGQILYRGLENTNNASFIIRNVRKDRLPAGINVPLHQILVDIFKKLGFNANRDNSIFCTGDKNQATIYGIPYVIFPVGHFDFTWSPKVTDLYNQFSDYSDVDKIKDTYIKIKYNNSDEQIFQRDVAKIDNVLKHNNDEILFRSIRDYKNNHVIWYGIKNDFTIRLHDLIKQVIPEPEFSNIMISGAQPLYNPEVIFKKIKALDYQHTNLQEAIDSHKEIMISCEKFYAVAEWNYRPVQNLLY